MAFTSLPDLVQQAQDAEGYLKLLRFVNPTLCHFFSYFLKDRTQAFSLTVELADKLLAAQGKLPGDEPPSLPLLTGALKLLSRHQPVESKDFLQRVRESVYDELVLQPMSDRFFDKDSLPDKDTIVQMRRVQLSSPRRFLLDLVVLEGLGSTRTAKLLGLSDSVLEAHLFTLMDQLMNHPAQESAHSAAQDLNCFVRMIHGEATDSQGLLAQRLNRLLQGLRIDIRERFEEKALLNETTRRYPGFTPEKLPPVQSSGSMIDAIRRQNELRNQQDGALPTDSTQQFSVDAWSQPADQKMTKAVKPAAAVLVLFFSFSLFKTMLPEEKNLTVESGSQTATISLEAALNQAATAIGKVIRAGLESPVYIGERVKSLGREISLSGSGYEALIKPASCILALDQREFMLEVGSVELQVQQNALISTEHGSISGKDGLLHLARLDSDYSLAAAIRGEFFLRAGNGETMSLIPGKQTRFGQGKAMQTDNYHPAAYSYESKLSEQNSLGNSLFFDTDQGADSSLSISKEKLLNEMERRPITDFRQNL